ncbi:helix-turn-helix transcriptional regulator (plasmid) [Haloferax sp. S1W]|uniref:helix-turn-helix transcriptional regulator n=1 Tax=Haloferax sp. S1W TaxID=3377110 RepID=UPI0037C95CE1
MKKSDVESVAPLLERAHTLAAIRGGERDRMEIAERADCSRATVYRATSDFEEQGLVEHTPNGYRLTGLGQTVLTQAEQFQAGVEAARHLEPVLAYTSPPELLENIHLFTDATVVEAEPSAPYIIEQEIEAIIREVDEYMTGITRGFGSPKVMETTFEQIHSGVEVEWVLTQETFAGVRTQYDESHTELLSLETTATYAVDEAPLDIGIYDDTMIVAGFDDETGTVGAIAITDNPAAVNWGRRLVAEYRKQGERLN